jgi:hypothetical protein
MDTSPPLRVMTSHFSGVVTIFGGLVVWKVRFGMVECGREEALPPCALRLYAHPLVFAP